MGSRGICAQATRKFAASLHKEGIPCEFISSTHIIVRTNNTWDMSIDINPNFCANIKTDSPYGNIVLMQTMADGTRKWGECPQIGYNRNDEDTHWYNVDNMDLIREVRRILSYKGMLDETDEIDHSWLFEPNN